MNRKMMPAVLIACALLGAACSTADDADTMDGVDTTTVAPPVVQAPAGPADRLDPDAASNDALLAVPGMTPALVDAIVAGRPYADMAALDRVLASTMDEAGRDTVYTRVWKRINLNSASDAEMLLIPGVGDRMLREFKEYRPFQNIEHFRREIGKYVDAAEVARLESYIAIQ